MPARKSEAVWNGTLKEGAGRVSFGSKVYEGPYTFAGRFEDGTGTNPEENLAQIRGKPTCADKQIR